VLGWGKRYKLEGRGFDCLDFLLTLAQVSTQPVTDEYQGYLQGSKGGRCVGPPLHADCLEILGTSTSCSPKGLSRLVQGLLFIVHMRDELLQKLEPVIQTRNNAHTRSNNTIILRPYFFSLM